MVVYENTGAPSKVPQIVGGLGVPLMSEPPPQMFDTYKTVLGSVPQYGDRLVEA